MEYFQNDIYIPTVDTEISIMTAEQYFTGQSPNFPIINLKPEGMIPCISPIIKTS